MTEFVFNCTFGFFKWESYRYLLLLVKLIAFKLVNVLKEYISVDGLSRSVS